MYSTPHTEDESDEILVQRIIQDGKDAGEQAAATGTAIHQILQGYFSHGVFDTSSLPDELQDNAAALYDFLKEHRITGMSETSFACHRHGYGGQIDFYGSIDNTDAIIDFKTQNPKSSLKSGKPSFSTYPEWAYQLSAYRQALADHDESHAYTPCVSIVISVNPDLPGVKMKHWPEQHAAHMNMQDAIKIFTAALKVYKTQYRFGDSHFKETPTTLLRSIQHIEALAS